jgi:hypothetical protein
MESTYRANATDEVVVKATTRCGEHGHCGTASCDKGLLLGTITRSASEERRREAEGLNVTGPRAGVAWPRAEKPSDKRHGEDMARGRESPQYGGTFGG